MDFEKKKEEAKMMFKKIKDKGEEIYRKNPQKVVWGLIVLVIVLLCMTVIDKCNRINVRESEEDIGEIILEWEEMQVGMGNGEIRELLYRYNGKDEPEIKIEGDKLGMLSVIPGGVRVKSLSSGLDTIMVKAGEYESVCIVMVRDDVFEFMWIDENGEAYNLKEIELSVGEIKKIQMRTELPDLMRTYPVVFQLMDFDYVQLVDVGDDYIVLEGIQKGDTVLMAEWRGSRARINVSVNDDVPRDIVVPYRKQYLNIGQETNVKVSLENGIVGDDVHFGFALIGEGGRLAIESSRNICVVKALREGQQSVRVTHPRARSSVDILFDVLPAGPPPAPEIVVSESPVMVERTQTKRLMMQVLNGKAGDNNRFSYSIAENEYALTVEQKGNVLHITGVAPGAAKLIITNPAVFRDFELMVMVDSFENEYTKPYY